MTVGTEPINKNMPQGAEPARGDTGAKLPWRNILWLALAAAILLAVVYLSPVRQYLGRLQELSSFIRGFGWRGPLVFTVSVALLVAVGFPRLFFCVLAGMAFGFWPGLLWAQLGTLAGNYAVFMVARSGGRNWAERYFARHTKLQNVIQKEGAAGVILARQLPVPGLLINMACGLFAIRSYDFFIGTIIGQLPEAIPCTLIGAGVLQASFRRSLGLISLAVAAAVLGWIGMRWILNRQKLSKPQIQP
jgi:uncharacterized membrane protein YdjX (TVP38/TMEM64 family)